MIPLPPIATRTATLCPLTTLFRSARALEFLILTASRTGEVIGATWSEIDFDAKVWTIPADRMKANKEHRVPLSARAVEILSVLSMGASGDRSEEHTSELQSLMRISYAVFCLQKQPNTKQHTP